MKSLTRTACAAFEIIPQASRNLMIVLNRRRVLTALGAVCGPKAGTSSDLRTEGLVAPHLDIMTFTSACSERPCCPLAVRSCPASGIKSQPIVGWIEGQSIPDGSRWRPMHNPIKLGLKEPKISVRSSARPPFSLPAGWIERPFAALRGKHLGKIGGQDQWPFLRIFKRKPLTILGPVKWHRFPKKNRLEIKEIPFFGLKWASENK